MLGPFEIEDVVLMICDFLGWRDILNLKQVNSEFLNIIEANNIDIVPKKIKCYTDHRRVAKLTNLKKDPTIFKYLLEASLYRPVSLDSENDKLNTINLLKYAAKYNVYTNKFNIYYLLFRNDVFDKIPMVNSLFKHDSIFFMACIHGVCHNENPYQAMLYLNGMITNFTDNYHNYYKLLSYFIRKYDKHSNIVTDDIFLESIEYLKMILDTEKYNDKIVNAVLYKFNKNPELLKKILKTLNIKITNDNFVLAYSIFKNKNNDILTFLLNDIGAYNVDVNVILEKVCKKTIRQRDHRTSDKFLIDNGAICCDNCGFKTKVPKINERKRLFRNVGIHIR